jgi:4-amino-4-deoxy-L-arabinose transferase-like glycosyltransferase
MSSTWQTTSTAAAAAPALPASSIPGRRTSRIGQRVRAIATRAPRPELLALLVLAGVLNLFSLARNGWANEYYAAAVRSMSTSWHDFLFASLDHSGVMTVDKPPLALWVQALSVRLFGYHPLSILVPQALMGMASVALVYDLVRRRFGRIGGFVGGLALALTPITVAISRHNNPDALLVLCCVGALWCVVRAFDAAPPRPSTRWLVLAGVCVGLGFETKMAVAFAVLPGIAAAWLWVAPAARGRWHALRQLLVGGAAMLLVGGAWPALVELVPARDRPWVSGTSDNRVLSLIFGYNGLGRVDGQTGGPGGGGGGGGGTMFGGSPGPLRLLNSALGGQAGWLLGFSLVSAVGLLVATRLRRADARTGWLLLVGGAFATTAVLFSAASGIFHPYYVSALVGAGAAELISGGLNARVAGPLAIAGGVVCELLVRSAYPGQLTWLVPLLIVVGSLAAFALAASGSPAIRMLAVATALAALLIAPTAWAFDTLGHATSSTFPAGGPASIDAGGFGGPGGRFGPRGGGRLPRGGSSGTPALFGGGGAPTGAGNSESSSVGAAGAPSGTVGPGSGSVTGAPPGASAAGGFPGAAGGSSATGPGVGGARGVGGGGVGPVGAPLGGGVSLTKILTYVHEHGGGTIAVSSQSSAASSIIRKGASVAGIGGFSGRESDVSSSWLAYEVSSGKIRWVLVEETGGGSGARMPGDSRKGSQTAMAAAAKACTKAPLSTSASSGVGTLYDCQGHASELASAGTTAGAQESRS